MRRALVVLAGLIASASWATDGRAQTSSGFDDPFFLYYSYFLPRQAALAAQPNVSDTINANVAARQSYATTNRANLYDPNGGYGAFDGYDPNSVFDNPTARGRGAGRSGPALTSRGLPTTNIAGHGPALYYNRAALYHPSLRNGQGPNKNLAVPGRGVRGGRGAPTASAYNSMPSASSPR